MPEASGQGLKPSRHDVAWINPAKTDCCADLVSDPILRPLVRAWVAGGRPLVVRQQVRSASMSRDTVALGLSLPPAAGRQRLALEAPWDAIDRLSPAPRLCDVVERVAIRWRASLSLLLELGQEVGILFRVFGSAAWEALTGIAYLSERSDLDLLWRPGSRMQLSAGLDVIDRWQRATGVLADGEILFARDLAVSCREWKERSEVARVMVKHSAGVALRTRAELLRTLPHSSNRAASLRALA